MRQVAGLVDAVFDTEVAVVVVTDAGVDAGELVDIHFFCFTSQGLSVFA